MNFGNFFRNISSDKQSGNESSREGEVAVAGRGEGGGGGGGGGRRGGDGESTGSGGIGSSLFAAPSRLFESINAKTESLVSDFTHKVDLANKLGSIKKFSSIDKIGQSVMKAAFPSKVSDELVNEPHKVSPQPSPSPHHLQSNLPDQTNYEPPALTPAPPPPPLPSSSQAPLLDSLPSIQPPPQQQQQTYQGYRYKKSDVWPDDFSSRSASTFNQSSNNKSSPHDFSNKSTTSLNLMNYEYRPTGDSQQPHKSQRSFSPDYLSQYTFDAHSYKKMESDKSQKVATNPLPLSDRNDQEPAFSMQHSLTKGTYLLEDQIFNAPQLQDEKTNQNQAQAINTDFQFISRNSQQSNNIIYHENPFNKSISLDMDATTIQAAALVKRQNTTPGSGPPRPPPPRSRSESQPLHVNPNLKASKKDFAFIQPSSTADSTNKPPRFEEGGMISSSSPEEISYLTRLQCQEIVSAVDDMIADAISESENYNPVKQVDTRTSKTPLDNYRSSKYPASEVDSTHQCTHIEHEGRNTPKGIDESHKRKEVEEDATQKDKSSLSADECYTYPDVQGNNSEDARKRKEIKEMNVKSKSDGHLLSSRGSDPQEAEDLTSFITNYVQQMVIGNEAELENKNMAFKERILTSQGRAVFSKAFELEGVLSGGLLTEAGLRAILSRVVFMLTECQMGEDFVPAKRLLTSSVVYYIEDPTKVGEKVFLFSYIKSQPIWQSLRFWNACFFQSVQETRSKLIDQLKSPREVDQAIVEQIGSYLNTMQVFDLHATIREEFLRKQGDLFNLSQDDMETLSALIENPENY